MWVARDKDGTLTLFSEKPIRIDNDDDMWLSFVWYPENVHTCKRMRLNSTEFPNLKWEDEPIEVKLVLKGADVIEMPSEYDVSIEAENFVKHLNDNARAEARKFGFRAGVDWLKSKVK